MRHPFPYPFLFPANRQLPGPSRRATMPKRSAIFQAAGAPHLQSQRRRRFLSLRRHHRRFLFLVQSRHLFHFHHRVHRGQSPFHHRCPPCYQIPRGWNHRARRFLARLCRRSPRFRRHHQFHRRLIPHHCPGRIRVPRHRVRVPVRPSRHHHRRNACPPPPGSFPPSCSGLRRSL